MGKPTDHPYGERSGAVKDFAGNHWYMATRFASTVAPEGMGNMMPYLFPEKARALIDFLRRAFGAEEMGVYEDGGRVMHAAVRIGDAVVEMGEARDEIQSLPCRFFLYVDDSDAWYRRAIGAGATSVQEPADQPYGHRTAMVEDPFGYQWVTGSLLK